MTTERAWNTTDEAEIKRLREYIAALKAQLLALRHQDPVWFWWDEMARFQKIVDALEAIDVPTDAQQAALDKARDDLANAIFRYRLARAPKRNGHNATEPEAWVDITGDVVFAQTEFTQAARTGPGSFKIVLKGDHPEYRSGEEIHLEVDDLRVFGGWVTGVERGYFFEDAVAPKTTLIGTDYNILFDRLAMRNYPAELASPESYMLLGPYPRWPDFPQGTLDSEMIETVFGTYMLPDLPLGFDYTNGVDSVSTPAPVAPWAMPESGSILRRFMSSVSQITSAVWCIDAYQVLQYHDREVVTAPFPLTDGYGGISSANLTVTSDISNMANDVIVWGTLAQTVEGEIMVWHELGDLGFWERYYLNLINICQAALNKLLAIPSYRRTRAQVRAIAAYQRHIRDYKTLLADARARSWDPLSGAPRPNNAIVNSIDTWGRWQLAEFREDIHHQEWLTRRAHSILTRYDEPIIKATATIWDPYYQAGQVIEVRSRAHGLDVPLVARQLRTTFSVAKEPHDGKFFALPRYDLEMGLDPEAPWNIYDYLPFPGEPTPGSGGDTAGG